MKKYTFKEHFLELKRRFLKIIQPQMAFFIKYEYWPNYLNELKKCSTPTYLISGIFRPNQLFFKWYGGFYRNALDAFSFFFVQNENSQKLIEQLIFSDARGCKISGCPGILKIISASYGIDIYNFACKI